MVGRLYRLGDEYKRQGKIENREIHVRRQKSEINISGGYFVFCKQKTAYRMRMSLVGSVMCIRDRI